MPNHHHTARPRDALTVRGWRVLIALGAACALFVGVAIAVASMPTEPPVSTQAPAAHGDAASTATRG